MYPLAFLPKELSSHKTFMTADDDWQSSIQSYIPEINETNWRRQKGQSTCSNLNIRRNIHHGPDGKKMLNITNQRRGLQREQKMLHEMLIRLRSNFCERVEITPLVKFTTERLHGIKCQNLTDGSCRYLDLKSMLKKSCEYLCLHTQHWEIDPIVDYYTLNLAACLVVSHMSLLIMSDSAITQPVVRAQHCETFVYVNQLLRTQKSGRLYKKTKQQLTRSVRGYPHNRELMLPFISDEIYHRLSTLVGVPYRKSSLALISADHVHKIGTTSSDILTNRICRNGKKGNSFNLNVLKCEGCSRLFFGGRGENDVRLFQEHLRQYPNHRLPDSNQKITAQEWTAEFSTRQKELTARYNTFYSSEQKQAYDAIMQGSATVVLMGVAGSGKSTLIQDVRYLMECVFWRKNEIALCGVTNAIAQRMGINGSSFHRFLGLRPNPKLMSSEIEEWNLSVEHCLQNMRKHKKRLKLVRVVILEEGLELQSNVLEAYFRFKEEIEWDVITLVNGDPCQGIYREGENNVAEVSFFAKKMLIAEICPNVEVFTFIQDLRTKNIQLLQAKAAVRNAQVTSSIFQYLKTLKYRQDHTNVDIILCTHISSMNAHNERLLAKFPGAYRSYNAKSAASEDPWVQHPNLTYKKNGVENVLKLKKGVPIIITQDVDAQTSRNTNIVLRNGTVGKVVELLETSIKVTVPVLGDIIAEIKQVMIYDTIWNQIPVVLAFAATIAKCIGFEFDAVALDFGIQGRSEQENAMQCSAGWRQKMAYTAMTRAKQEVYFVGENLHINLFNNMDKLALGFFNEKLKLNQQVMNQTLPVVRDVQELKEYWIQSMQSSNVSANEMNELEEEVNTSSQQNPNCDIFGGKTRKHIACIDGKIVEIHAHTYPNVVQHIHGQGYIVSGTSHQYRNVLLKIPCAQLSNPAIVQAECNLLRLLNDSSRVLQLLAPLHRNPATLVMEGMHGRVSWKQFILHATADAKKRYQTELNLALVEIHDRQIAHGFISDKSVFTNMRGDVKLTWFQSHVQFIPVNVQKDKADAQALCNILQAAKNTNLDERGNDLIGSEHDDNDVLNHNDCNSAGDKEMDKDSNYGNDDDIADEDDENDDDEKG